MYKNRRSGARVNFTSYRKCNNNKIRQSDGTRYLWKACVPGMHIFWNFASTAIVLRPGRRGKKITGHRTQSRTFAYMINSVSCLPLIWFGKTSEIFWIQTISKLWERERERERERETLALAYESLVISKHMYRCWKASRAHRLLHDKVGYSTVLMLCMLSIAWPNV